MWLNANFLLLIHSFSTSPYLSFSWILYETFWFAICIKRLFAYNISFKIKIQLKNACEREFAEFLSVKIREETAYQNFKHAYVLFQV